jgi:hypothetical protein
MSIITKTAVDRCISKLKANIYDDALSKISRIEDREKIKKWIQYKVNAFLSTSNMFEEEEFQLALMWFYVQLKAEWSQINTHFQFQQMRGFELSPSFYYRLKVLSITIKEIENFINIYHVDGVASFLSLPMSEFER